MSTVEEVKARLRPGCTMRFEKDGPVVTVESPNVAASLALLQDEIRKAEIQRDTWTAVAVELTGVRDRLIASCTVPLDSTPATGGG